MLHIACCLWEYNLKSQEFSRCFNESWVYKLYNGFKRNLTQPFEFVVFSDRPRNFDSSIRVERLKTLIPSYGCLVEPFRLDAPMIVCGLDMVVLQNVDHFANYCLTADKPAFPRNPYKPDQLINPMGLVPSGYKQIFDGWRGQNDMDYLRKWPCNWIDDMWPGQVLSCKFHKIRLTGPGDARVIYFHGVPKPHELMHLDWVKDNWK